MADSPYFSIITSESSFRARFAAEQGKSFSELHDAAASEWGRHHLFACRVVRRVTQRNVLPMLSGHTLPSDARSSTEIIKFLDGPGITHMAQSEHRLVRDPACGHSLGQVWAALAAFKGHPDRQSRRTDDTSDAMDTLDDESSSGGEASPKRARRNTRQDDYVDSSMIPLSSSPMAEDSQGSSSVGYIDSESHRFLAYPEDETLRLVSCVIRHILYFAPPQDSETEQSVVEFRDAKLRLAAPTPLRQRRIGATDDGGLHLRQEVDGVFTVARPHIAILEAKSRFHSLENGRPIISDRCFAQMTCEALVARLADPSKNR
ncbi:hypothetical protein TOPH_04347 [Tolypocladium ophioglossoides CBS 100239]|uniref:Uncharacterized protein n=1 Tax=Tolypocladium ophioglossoides (strain CBS 100239) TaxID=1163406 RepID=A0A0L0NA72_TOLOC|nr:hypothetical protein TOPH_04347 [Tolypocladium ophioglossoides CBS 100239]